MKLIRRIVILSAVNESLAHVLTAVCDAAPLANGVRGCIAEQA